jgi:hypothetical protein
MNNQDGAGFPKDNHCLQYNPAMNAINPLQNISRIAELKHRSQAANSLGQNRWGMVCKTE